MRFRRRAKVFPGVYLNFSSSGMSTTIGPRGFNVNFGKHGTNLNTGIPGTGLYDRHRLDSRPSKNRQTNQEFQNSNSIETIANYIQICTEDIEQATSEGLQDLKNNLINCHLERQELEQEINKAKTSLTFASLLYFTSCVFIAGFFIRWFRLNQNEKKEYLIDLQEQLKNCYIDIDINLEQSYEEHFSKVHQYFKQISSCDKIWDLTSEASVDRQVQRSLASSKVMRKQVIFGHEDIEIIRTKYSPMHLENSKGGSIYIYPTFLAILDSRTSFGLIDIRDLSVSFYAQRFIESETVSSDATVVDKTWAKVNKDGSPDKRFKENYQIPICKYGELYLKSKTGLNEAYSFSSYEKSEPFAKAFLEFLEIVKNKKGT